MSDAENMIRQMNGWPENLRAETAKLRVENAALRAALEAVEWYQSPTGIFCPWCNRAYTWGEMGPYKHKPDCQRQIALGLSPKPGE